MFLIFFFKHGKSYFKYHKNIFIIAGYFRNRATKYTLNGILTNHAKKVKLMKLSD